MRNPFRWWKVRQFLSKRPRAKWGVFLEWLTSQRQPMISVTTVWACPNKCRCCPWMELATAGKARTRGMMGFEDFKLYLFTVPKSVVIEFCGFTEALMNPQTVDMLEYAYREGYRVRLSTTLVGATREGMARLATIRLDELRIHLPDDTNFVIDENRWLGFYRLLDGLKFPTAIYGALGVVPDSILQAVGDVHIHYPEVIVRPTIENEGVKDFHVGPLVCGFGGEKCNQTVLLPDGDVAVCYMDYELRNIIGNLKTDAYSAIMNGERVREFRRRMQTISEDVLCRRCDVALPVELSKIRVP